LILSVEQGTPLLVALGFEGHDLLLPPQLFFQRQRGRGGTACFLDLAFQAYLEVVGPAVELVGLGLEETCASTSAPASFSTLSGGQRRVSTWAKYFAW